MKTRFSLRPKRRLSLKQGLLGIVIVCWTLSILIIMVAMRFYSRNQMAQQAKSTVKTSVTSAVDLSVYNIRAAMDASRQASLSGTIREAYARFIATNKSNKYRLYDSVVSYLNLQYRRDTKFITTMLYFCDEPEFIYYTSNNAAFGSYNSVRIFKNGAQTEVQTISETLGTGICFFNYDETVYMVRNIVDSDYNPYAVLVMEIAPEALFEGLGSVLFVEGARIHIDDADIALLDSVGEPRFSDVGYVLTETKDGHYLVSDSRMIDRIRIRYYFEIDAAAFTAQYRNLNWLMILLLCGVGPLLAFATYLYYKHLSLPINDIVGAAERIAGGEMGYQIDCYYASEELAQLADCFNKMSASMKQQFEQSYNEQLALQDARMKALVSQINPHFLNNTLESINWEARMNGDVKVSKMIESLSVMLNAATARGGKPTVRLSQEMEFVDAYLYILSERMGQRLTLTREIDEALLGCDVPRLILQPIVENAIEHGIGARPRGCITIRVRRQGDDMLLETVNDGAMSESDRAVIERLLAWDGKSEDVALRAGHIGIRNVNQRLKIMYGEAYGLTIENDEEGQTVARIIVPISGLA